MVGRRYDTMPPTSAASLTSDTATRVASPGYHIA